MALGEIAKSGIVTVFYLFGHTTSKGVGTNMKIAENVYGIRTGISNVAVVTGLGPSKQDYVLIDAGIPFCGSYLQNALKKIVGDKQPLAIILTHGHFDHIGAISHLFKSWDVPIYAHVKELPYLQGKKVYDPPHPFRIKGLLSFMSPFYPRDGIMLTDVVNPLESNKEIPYLTGWQMIHTPGHTEGHISIFRNSDRLLLAGDAIITVKQESLFAVLQQRKELHGPPAYFTPNRYQAKQSIIKLAEYMPEILYSGHGKPMHGQELTTGLKKLIKQYEWEGENAPSFS